MTKVLAGITTSVDGYITGPHDGPGQRLGEGGEMGGADIIRRAVDTGLVDELTIIIAPVILGGGKPLFDGFSSSLDLERLGVRQSRYATFIDYRVKHP